jgi:acetylornithine/succinyldiaminopimelate/putrescine aminotransferase
MEHSSTASPPQFSDAEILASAECHLMNTYHRPAIVFSRGKGCKLYDSQGRAYLDFLGGLAVNALGYSHPRIVKVIRREAARAIHISNLFHNSFQAPLAEKWTELWRGTGIVAEHRTEFWRGRGMFAHHNSHAIGSHRSNCHRHRTP